MKRPFAFVFVCLLSIFTMGFLIIPGRDARKGQFPGVVALKVKLKDGNSALCTGVFIDRRRIVTAAHCIYGLESYDEITYSDDPNASGVQSQICGGVFPTQGLLAYNSKTNVNDIGIVFADKEYQFPSGVFQAVPHVSKIKLPIKVLKWDKIVNLSINKSPIFIGYGLNSHPDIRVVQEKNPNQDVSRAVAMLILGVRNKESYDRIKVDRSDDFSFYYSSNLRTGEDTMTCKGDSGGPTILDDGTLIGVTSAGDDQCNEGVSTRVDAYLSWIDGAKTELYCAKKK